MQFDRKIFFDKVRLTPFPGALSVTQVAGCEAIIAEFERRGLTDWRWLAYMLATAFHETAKTMQPIAEYGRGKGHKYGNPVNGKVYYGRGYVQLTWDYNYKKMGDLLHVDLLGNPELALKPDVAAKIMFEGMIRGTFTGKKLADYLHDHLTDFGGARKIINGTDRAETIASYARQFHGALIAAAQAAGDDHSVVIPPPPDIAPVPAPPPKPNTTGGAIGGSVVVGGGAIVASETKKAGADTSQVVIVLACVLVIALAVFFVVRHWRRS